MSDNSSENTLNKVNISEANKESQSAKRFIAKHKEIVARFNAHQITAEAANQEIKFFQEKYNTNIAAEKKRENASGFYGPVGVPLLPRIYYALSGLVNEGLKGAAYGWKKEARTFAPPEVRSGVDFQQIQDELAYFKATQLPTDMSDKEQKAWNKVSGFVQRKATEDEKWGIKGKKFEKNLVKHLERFVEKVREDEMFAQRLSEQGMVAKEDMAPLSPEKIKRNQGIANSVNNLVGYFKQKHDKKNINISNMSQTKTLSTLIEKGNKPKESLGSKAENGHSPTATFSDTTVKPSKPKIDNEVHNAARNTIKPKRDTP